MSNEFRVRLWLRIATKHSTKILHIRGLIGSVTSPRTTCRFRIKEFSGIVQVVHFVLQFLNLSYKLIHLDTIFLKNSLFLFCFILCITSCVFLESNQIIFSLGKVPSFENEAVDRIVEKLCLQSRPSILARPARILLQKANNLFQRR